MTDEMIVMTEPEVRFATVGSVFDDGVTLIFDGQTAATEKHYKCNTSVLFHAGDRVKIASDSGTYVVEYIVGNPGANAPVPKGGTSGQVLAKKSGTDGDVVWKNISSGSTTGKLPSGGTTGQYLKKKATPTTMQSGQRRRAREDPRQDQPISLSAAAQTTRQRLTRHGSLCLHRRHRCTRIASAAHQCRGTICISERAQFPLVQAFRPWAFSGRKRRQKRS